MYVVFYQCKSSLWKMSTETPAFFTCSRRITQTKRILIAYVLGPLLLWSPSRIRRTLHERGYKFVPSLSAISLFCKRFRSTGKINDQSGRGRKSQWKHFHSDAVDQLIRQNREVTMKEIRQMLVQSFGLKTSIENVRQKVLKLGWRKTQTRYCQMVRHANKTKRLVFALHCMHTDEQFDDVVFTDEASVELSSCGNLRFRRKDEPAGCSKVSRPKHPLKVHVWAGISPRGATKICIFRGIMNSAGYQRILREHLIPFGNEVFPDGYRLMQDNDPKHTSKSTQEFFKRHNIVHWPTPPESPDMNPIEMMWSLMKRYLSKNIKPKTKQDLVEGIGQFWHTVTPELCRNFISHLKKVIPIVILRDGAATGC